MLVFDAVMDGVDPEVIDRIHTIAGEVPGVTGVTDVRARWVGHRLRAEVNISVGPELTVRVAHRSPRRWSTISSTTCRFCRARSSTSIR